MHSEPPDRRGEGRESVRDWDSSALLSLLVEEPEHTAVLNSLKRIPQS